MGLDTIIIYLVKEKTFEQLNNFQTFENLMTISDNKIKGIPRHYMINCKNKWEIL